MEKTAKKIFYRVWPYFILIICLTVSFTPIVWVVCSSLKPAGYILTIPPFYFPKTITLQHYYDLFFKRDISPVFLNSLTIALASTAISIVFGTLAAYVFARSKRNRSTAISAILPSPIRTSISPISSRLRSK